MQYPSSITFNPQKTKINKLLIVLFVFDLLLLFMLVLTMNLNSTPVKLIGFFMFGTLLLLTLIGLFRMIVAKQTGKWLKISKNGLRDHSSFLGLGRIPVEDIRSLRVVTLYGTQFLRARISQQSECFHDLDEPKGLIVDVYNIFFKGKVYWPLSLVDINEEKLKEYLAYYKEYIKHLRAEQTIMPQKSLKKWREKPLIEKVDPVELEADVYNTQEEIPEPPALPINIDEVTSIELDEDSRMLPIDNHIPKDGDTQTVGLTGFDKTINLSTVDSLNFARKLCDAYVEGLRWLPKVSEGTHVVSDISSVQLEKPTENLEVLSFTYKGLDWKISVERQDESLMAYMKLLINEELKYEIDVAVELGSLEPTRLLHDSEGLWKQQALELFENLQQNKSFTV